MKPTYVEEALDRALCATGLGNVLVPRERAALSAALVAELLGERADAPPAEAAQEYVLTGDAAKRASDCAHQVRMRGGFEPWGIGRW